jgi:hypothetical protein
MKNRFGLCLLALQLVVSSAHAMGRRATEEQEIERASDRATAVDEGTFEEGSSSGAFRGGVRSSTSTINDPETYPDRVNTKPPPESRREDGTASPTRDGMGTTRPK